MRDESDQKYRQKVERERGGRIRGKPTGFQHRQTGPGRGRSATERQTRAGLRFPAAASQLEMVTPRDRKYWPKPRPGCRGMREQAGRMCRDVSGPAEMLLTLGATRRASWSQVRCLGLNRWSRGICERAASRYKRPDSRRGPRAGGGTEAQGRVRAISMQKRWAWQPTRQVGSRCGLSNTSFKTVRKR